MKLYFAGAESIVYIDAINRGGGENCLVSYHQLQNKPKYLEKNSEYYGKQKRVFLDSGAFTAATKGITIDIDKYINYIKDNINNIAVHACLDVIGDPKKTEEQQLYMESQGVTPLPVFHFSKKNDYSIFEKMCEKYDYIALGGVAMGIRDMPRVVDHFNKCFKIVGRYWAKGRKIRIHGFGVTAVSLLTQYPFYSADSTSWLSGPVFGNLYKWEGTRFSQTNYKKKAAAKFVNVELVQSYKGSYVHKALHNVIEFVKMEKYITALWTKRGITWDQ
ncbi:hypothetical protein KAU11_12085 [Candidatus Babeliales bacterium]|nr:hypothetical protein [Candidatus Babeliales bacterium]